MNDQLDMVNGIKVVDGDKTQGMSGGWERLGSGDE